ncbi:MAG: SpoIIE family protein phosphatase [Ignavibacteriae bacterium]|nr:SpoIIE family protein phosphatase [Ignavibacteriota bacterium]
MTSNRKQLFLFIFIAIVVVSVLEGMRDALVEGDSGVLVGQLIVLAIIGYVAWRSRETLQSARERYRQRFEESQDTLSVKDAALFSLSWSMEIYRGIPQDRKRLVKQAFLLIGLGMALVWLQLGSNGLTTLVLVGALVLAGVNLLVWVFSSERGERDRLRIELDTARHMQLSLMPTGDPCIRGYDIAGFCAPARDVGGDHFDYAHLGDGRFAVAVVDVAGKGMDAAMTAVFTSGAFVATVQVDTDVPRVMTTLNTAVRSRADRTRFVSFFLLALKPASGEVEYCNAGQTRPLLLRNGEVLEMHNKGAHFPLGLVDNPEYTATNVVLRPGDLLLLFTDGLSEAMNPAREIFGAERIAETLRGLAARDADAATCIATIRDDVTRHAAGAEQHDDVTLVVIRPLAAPVEETAAP